MAERNNDQTYDIEYVETGDSTAFEVSAVDLARKEYGRQLSRDRLFQPLTPDERNLILSDDIALLDPQRHYSLTEVATMLSALQWVPDRLSDSSLRHWFNADESDLERYVEPEKVGRKRLLPILSVLRMRLISYWHWGKNFSIQQINDIVFDVQRVTQKEWSPNMSISVNDLQNIRIPPDKMGEFMAWYSNQMLEAFAGGFNPVEETITKIQKSLGIVKEDHDDLLAEQLVVMRQMWEISAKDELRTEALRLWQDSPNRFEKQLFGLVKTENTTAKELYVADYIQQHITKKVDEKEDEYMKRLRSRQARLSEGKGRQGG